MPKKRQTVLGVKQAKELGCALLQAIPPDLPPAVAQHWIGHKKQLAAEIKEIFLSVASEATSNWQIIAEWQVFYRALGINCDLSNVTIPDNPGDFNRVIIMAQGITPKVALDLCKKHFSCSCYRGSYNLDKDITSERTTQNGPYAVRFRNRRESDRELKNLSSYDLRQQGILGITLEERFIYGVKYYRENGKHLDVRNKNLCSGSRDSRGHVPRVSENNCTNHLTIGWTNRHEVRDDLRSREAIV